MRRPIGDALEIAPIAQRLWTSNSLWAILLRMWEVATTDDFDAWFAELGEDAQVEVIAKVTLLRMLGPRLGRRMRTRSRIRSTPT